MSLRRRASWALALCVGASAGIVAGAPRVTAHAGAHSITISSPQQFSESAGTAVIQVGISPATDGDESLTVAFSTANGSAVNGQDYTLTQGTLPIGPNTSTAVINVPLTNDNGAEANEDFFIDLSNPTCTETTPSVPLCSASIADGNGAAFGTGTVVILDDDGAARAASIGDASANEGNTATFTVTLSTACPSGTAMIPYDTNGANSGTASQGTDYPRTQGTLVFDANVLTRTLTVNTIEDTADEQNETFTVFLGTPTGTCSVTINDGQGQGTIVDDDPGPAPGGSTLSVADKQVNERDHGTRLCRVPVRLDPASSQVVTVQYETADGTATEGEDYQATSGTLTFQPGQQAGTVSVTVIGDTRNERGRRERLFVNLSNPTGGASIGDDQGRCVIYEGTRG